MAETRLNGVSLGFQLVWNPLRQIAGVELFISPHSPKSIDAEHLLGTLKEFWTPQSPQLILSVRSKTLLLDILERGEPDCGWIEISPTLLEGTAWGLPVKQAALRGMTLIWRGAAGNRPSPELNGSFAKTLVKLEPELVKLKHNRLSLPIAGNLFETPARREFTEYLLDKENAWGVLGWPTKDVLYSMRKKTIQASRHVIVKLMQALDTDAPLKEIELILGEDQVLSYQFLQHLNAAALGLEAKSLRQGLMLLGNEPFKDWLSHHLPSANNDINIHPIRTAMVVQASLVEHLFNARNADELCQDIHLCSLLSQIDKLLGESLAVALKRLPLSEHTLSALLKKSGPYAPYLKLAKSLESPSTQVTRKLCANFGLRHEDVNSALLHTLANALVRSN